MKMTVLNIRSFIGILIFTVSVGTLFSQEKLNVDFFDAEKPDFTVKVSGNYNILQDSTNGPFGVSALFKCDMNQLQSTIGGRYELSKVDLQTSHVYAPVFNDCFKLGLFFNYHFYTYQNDFFENDILPGLYFEWFKGSVFSFKIVPVYMAKIAVIPSAASGTSKIITNTVGISTNFTWKFNFCTLYFDAKTFGSFDYPIFCSPIFELGAEKQIWGPLAAGLDINSEWIDMFTIAMHPTTFAVEVFVKVVF